MNLARRPGHHLFRAITRPLAVASLMTGGLAMAAVHARSDLALAAVAHAQLTDDADGTALFASVSGLSPGSSVTSCITVGAQGVPATSTVVLSATDVVGALAGSLALSVDAGSGGGFGDCSGFAGSRVFTGSLDGMAAATGDGVATGWSPATTPVRTFRFTVGLPAGTPATAMQQEAQADFEWRLVTVPPEPADPDPADPDPADPDPADPDPVAPTAPAQTPPAPTAPAQPVPLSSPAADPPGARLHPEGHRAAPRGPDDAEVDLRMKPGLAQRLTTTVQAVVSDPQFVAGPFLLAALFLLVQHLIDRRDPKLANASRTGRELTLRFPTTYEEGSDR